jgi:chromosome partitioning protein
LASLRAKTWNARPSKSGKEVLGASRHGTATTRNVTTWSREHAAAGQRVHAVTRHVATCSRKEGRFMRTLVLTTQKGGAGKTTLAASLAVAAQQDGERVLAVDIDPQGSLWSWSQRRGLNGVKAAKSDAADLKRFLAQARQEGAGAATLAIVDTPGQFGGGVTLALQDADLCLMPVKPSILDVEASRPTVEQLRRIGRPYAFVLNQCSPSSQSRTIDAATALVKAGALAPSMVATRTDFLDAMTTGQGVTEYAPKGKAAQEITLLWQWVKSRLEGLSHG